MSMTEAWIALMILTVIILGAVWVVASEMNK
mgnify:CR=1 FL=1